MELSWKSITPFKKPIAVESIRMFKIIGVLLGRITVLPMVKPISPSALKPTSARAMGILFTVMIIIPLCKMHYRLG